MAPPPPAKAATPPPPLPTAAPVAAHGIAAAEELDSLDRELRDLCEPRPDEHFEEVIPDPLAHTVVEGTTAGMGNLEVVMEFGADEDDDGGLRDEDEGL